jgi:hypothetical protein
MCSYAERQSGRAAARDVSGLDKQRSDDLRRPRPTLACALIVQGPCGWMFAYALLTHAVRVSSAASTELDASCPVCEEHPKFRHRLYCWLDCDVIASLEV